MWRHVSGRWVMGQVGLAEVLGLLRDELDAAQRVGQGHQFRFEITGAEVELLVEVVREGGLEGSVVLGVVSVSGKGEASRSNTHRISLKLAIKDAALGGRNLEVGRADPGSWRE
jgi:hypothetical protein